MTTTEKQKVIKRSETGFRAGPERYLEVLYPLGLGLQEVKGSGAKSPKLRGFLKIKSELEHHIACRPTNLCKILIMQ
jgi:hypothetical protein